MRKTADIRKENKKAIYHFMLDGGLYTKNQVSKGTGLSVATCNTLLNDLQNQGIVIGEEKFYGEVGRRSVLYQIREEHESYLGIYIWVEKEQKIAEVVVFSAIGNILYNQKKDYKYIDSQQLEAVIDEMHEIYPNLKQIIIAMPGPVDQEIARYCDVHELDGIDVKSNIEARFGIRTTIESDMHLNALGYYRLEAKENEVITLGYFPSHILPGTATIHKGKIICGAKGFAGMTGFLPYDVSRQEQLNMLRPKQCIPFVSMSISASIVLLNPSTMVLTGDLIDEETLRAVKEKCLESVPEEYMPEFIVVDSFEKYLFEGMFQVVVDKKVFGGTII